MNPGAKAREHILNHLANVVQRAGGDSAVVGAGQSLSFSSLGRKSDRLAQKLIANGIKEGTLLGVMTERTVDIAIAYIAALKAGAAFMPLAVDVPPDRNLRILRETKASALLTTTTALAATGCSDQYAQTTTLVEIGSRALYGRPLHVLPSAVPLTSAYVIHTSGSTGLPKGAINSVDALLNLVEGLWRTVYPHETVRKHVALVAPFVFDPSIQQLFSALLQGHCLHLVPDDARFDGGALLAFFNESKIDIADGTPTHLKLLANAPLSLGSRISTGLLMVGGEALTRDIVTEFWNRFGGPSQVNIVNLYGTAECAVDSTAYFVDMAEITNLGFLPIGRPLPGVTVKILNEMNEELGNDSLGEIVISGRSVGLGYLGQPALTDQRFVETSSGERLYRTGDLGTRTADGLFRCLGRRDRQIKIRGIRIEPGEIESAIRAFQRPETVSPPAIVSCERCLLDTRHPGVTVTDGLCSVCTRFDSNREISNRYFRTIEDFITLMNHARIEKRGEADCLLLYSGGKDSSYVLLKLLDLGYRVATFTFDNGYISSTALDNIERVTKRYGVKHVTLTLANMRSVFTESLRQASTVCDGCFRALTLLSDQFARQAGINVVVTGLSRGQIYETKLKRLLEEGISDSEEIDRRLRTHRTLFNIREDSIARTVGLNDYSAPKNDIYHVDFFRYDRSSTKEVLSFLVSHDERWLAPSDTGFCSTNCRANDVGIHVHQLERGFHNYSAPLSWDIRLGIANRSDAEIELREPVRVEDVESILAEFEYSPRDHSQGKIQEAFVSAYTGPAGQLFLCAYFLSSGSVNIGELRDHLARRLPSFMIPQYFARLDTFPITANGKVDIERLPMPSFRSEVSTTGEGFEIDGRLKDLWRSVLRVESIDPDDNFFDLGGDSLLATVLVSQIESELGTTTSVVDIFRHPSIREMARFLDSSKTQHHLS